MRSLPCFGLFLLFGCCLRQGVSYPTRAGSCIGSQPAVGEPHLAYGDGSRHVRSGDLRDSHVQLFIDGTDLTASESDLLIEVGAYHLVEIVADSRPFKGALIRAESTSTILSLDPLVNAGVESECSSTKAQGVSHVDNSPKNAFSAGLTVQNTGEGLFSPVLGSQFLSPILLKVTLDVTVVEYNNATGSVFWYSHFKLKAVVNLNDDQQVSDGDLCFVCGSDDGTDITEQSQVVMLAGLALTCPELSSLGRRSGIPVGMCDEATALAKASCGCLHMESLSIAETPSPSFAEKCNICGTHGAVVGNSTSVVTYENEEKTCQDLYQAGLMGLIPPFECGKVQQAALACNCTLLNNAPTYEPTVTPLPTYAEPCFVCGDASRSTSIDDVVQVDDVVVSCRDLLQDGLTGYLPPYLCLKAQQVAMQHCGCSQAVTLPPSASMIPTITPYPTADKCYVCGTGKEVSQHDAVIEIGGIKGTCRSLQHEGLSGYIPMEVCEKAKAVALAFCGCTQPQLTPCMLCASAPWTLTNLDTIIEVAGDPGTCEELDAVAKSNLLPDEFCPEAQDVARTYCGCSDETFEPTLTPSPTVTASPTYTNDCLVCSPGEQVTDHSAIVTVDGLRLTCEQLEEAGRNHLIPPIFCSDAQQQAASVCKCGTVRSPNLITLVPTITPFPTITYSPTFLSKCDLCPPDYFVTKRDTLVTLGKLLLTCEELEEAASERMISPSLCPMAKERAETACGCRKPVTLDVDSPASSPARTFHPTVTIQPTVTATPTYKFGCNVCGSSSRRVFEPDKVVRVVDIMLTCRDLEEAGREASIPPNYCPLAQRIALQECQCGAVAMTFSPTTSPAPTLTPAPSHHRHCQVCEPGWRVSNREDLVMIAGYAVTCSELESFGATGHLPPDLCYEAKQHAIQICMCLPETQEDGKLLPGGISFRTSGFKLVAHGWATFWTASAAIILILG